MDFVDNIAEIITGLENRTFEWGGSEMPAKGDEEFQAAVNTIAEILGGSQYNKWHLLAAETHIRKMNARVDIDDIDEYLEENFLYADATVASTIQGWAAADCSGGELNELYEALDKAGGVDRFDWGAYADDDMTPTNGLTFVQVPAPTGEDQVYLFQDSN
ncbi:hypothetical protein SEA_SATIS_297 [Streptomyces phage Satis]|nr:hypothetical protein SEA_SATIS_297 [Streptomyces phage Satis]